MADAPAPELPDAAPLGRRQALLALLGGALAVGCRPASSVVDDAGAPTTTDGGSAPDDRDPDVHLLRRASFGATAGELDRLRSMGRNAWLAEQLDPERIDTEEIDAELVEVFPELAQDSATTLAAYRADPDGRRLATVLAASTLVRHTASPAQLHERMVDFWGDHFNVPQTNPPSSIARIAFDRDVLRPNALGRFDELLIAVAQSPAMLLYLDNFRSTAGAINENYARELLELHTVGIDGGYDEDDIVATARLLTGWGITPQLEFVFRPRRHDDGAVSILGWERPTTGDPLTHGEDFLRHLASLPATARFVARKLATRFVADEPTAALVDTMTDAWLDHDSAIVPVVEAMFAHDDFASAPAKFNRPWDYLVQSIRVLEGTVTPTFGPELRDTIGLVQDLGQVPFRHGSPDGYPDVEADWRNAGAMLARWNTAAMLTDPSQSPFRSTVVPDLVATLGGAAAGEVIDALATRLNHQEPSAERRDLLLDLVGWSAADRPEPGAISEAAPTLAFVLLSQPEALYR